MIMEGLNTFASTAAEEIFTQYEIRYLKYRELSAKYRGAIFRESKLLGLKFEVNICNELKNFSINITDEETNVMTIESISPLFAIINLNSKYQDTEMLSFLTFLVVESLDCFPALNLNDGYFYINPKNEDINEELDRFTYLFLNNRVHEELVKNKFELNYIRKGMKTFIKNTNCFINT